jgi:hypothetical protein
MTAAQHSARIVLPRSGLFHSMQTSGWGRERRKSPCRMGLSSTGCASGHFRKRRANLADSEKRHCTKPLAVGLLPSGG